MPDVSQIMDKALRWIDDCEPGACIAVPRSDLRALLDEVKRLSETYKDSDGEVWNPPTAWAYAKVCEARTNWQTRATSAEALLREAGDVMRTAQDTGSFASIDAFLAKLKPSPKPIREDTYPDRVSMEPWPYSGHAPGGSDAK